MNDLARLVKVHAQSVERLRLAERFIASCAAITLHDAILVLEPAQLFTFTRAAMTVQLDLSRPSLTVILYLSGYH